MADNEHGYKGIYFRLDGRTAYTAEPKVTVSQICFGTAVAKLTPTDKEQDFKLAF